MFEKIKAYFKPTRKLALKLKYPEVKTLHFEKNRQGEIRVSDQLERVYRLDQLVLMRSAEEMKRGDSRGALVGTALAAARQGSKDVQALIRGAMIGDWAQKQYDQRPHHVMIRLIDDLDHLRQIETKVTEQQWSVLKSFFQH